jgi:hypothetical protein
VIPAVRRPTAQKILAAVGRDEGLVEDFVLADEAGQRREAGDGEDGDGHGPERDRDFGAEATHEAHVLLVREGVDDGAGGEEEQRFEEGMGDEVEDACGVRRDSAGEEHVAELRDGGVGEDALDVGLDDSDGRREERRSDADEGDGTQREGRAVEDDVGARDHVHARGDHGGGVDEGGDRSGAFHGVGEPDVERDLRGLAGGSEDEEERDGGEDSSLPQGMRADLAEDAAEAERAEVRDEKEHRDEESEVADAVNDEGFFAGVGGGVAREPEADEEIRGEAYAFPADEHEQEVFCEHEREHEEEEEVHVGEEAPVALVLGHVTDGVDVDQEADAGNDAEHDEGELIELEGEVGVESSGADPGAEGLDVGEGGEGAEFCNNGCDLKQWDQRRDEGDGGHERPGKLAAEETIHQKSGEGDERNEPEVKVGVHSFIRSMESTLRVLRARKTAMMMARPTAASAAATTITKKTKIWPLTWRCPVVWLHWREKAMKARLTALSMSSIDMKTVMMLRLMRNAATPMENRMALRTR